MSTLDLLLQLDEQKIRKPKKEVEVKRLSEVSGDKVVFKIEALTPVKMDEIQELAIDKDNDRINTAGLQAMTVVEGVKDPNFKSKELMDKFNVYTPKDLINKILLPGEVLTLYNMIGEISGFDGGAIEEIKN
ncbi:Phage XkdN-like tail assembly chaperone protein, TAC [Anaerovirgula multivorans]|uniref:Phage XkdN-like tail assembly chaperone protein, TAC n=1 Tax=Anaerovirgula multivorans TaxID=312168 RepID=A0A239KM85_9FIRM|nr:hypothetical protein [Anaerovirgula multivorans]SNT18699.1 Phage XkdN-like tail assembly chaperone protein, TAC [Anaerovirgula multivorans]